MLLKLRSVSSGTFDRLLQFINSDENVIDTDHEFGPPNSKDANPYFFSEEENPKDSPRRYCLDGKVKPVKLHSTGKSSKVIKPGVTGASKTTVEVTIEIIDEYYLDFREMKTASGNMQLTRETPMFFLQTTIRLLNVNFPDNATFRKPTE